MEGYSMVETAGEVTMEMSFFSSSRRHACPTSSYIPLPCPNRRKHVAREIVPATARRIRARRLFVQSSNVTMLFVRA